MSGGHGVDATTLIGLLIVVALVAMAVRFIRLPYSVALVVTGLALALAPNAPYAQLTPSIILTIFLPVLLFHGAYNFDLANLRANLAPVALLAVPGVAATTALVGVTLHLVAGFSWSEGLLFGAIVSATDPVAVLAIFGEVGAPRRLATIVNGESLFNDGTALVLFATILDSATGGHAVTIGGTVEHFVVEVVGALALGAVVALIGGAIVKHIDEALVEMTITLIMAYGGYLLADRLGVSGAIETATAGILLGARGAHVMSPTTRLQARATWEFLDFLANSLLFLLVGLQLRTVGGVIARHIGLALWQPLLIAIAAVIVARVVVIAAVTLALARARHPLPPAWTVVIIWGGLRGAVSLAAGLSLPPGLPARNLLLALTFGVVLFTLLIQGLSVRAVMQRLGLVAEEASRHDFELALGRLRATEAAAREVTALRQSDALDGHLAQRLEEQYARQRHTLRTDLDAMYHGNATLEQQHELEVQRRLLRVQREAVHNAFARGLISQTALRELEVDIDRELAQLEPMLAEEE